MKKTFNKNPFFQFFIVFALFCLVVLGLEFFSIIHSSNKASQETYHLEKMETMLDDLTLQLNNFETLAFRFSLNNTYAYSTLSQKKYNEMLLLNDFQKYKYSSPLTEELFLYYGGNNIFHIDGKTINLDVYLDSLSSSEKERVKAAIHATLESNHQKIQLFASEQNLYVLMPFKTGSGVTKHTSLLAGVISFKDFDERIQIITGGLMGTIFLYSGDELIYCNKDTTYAHKDKNTLCVSTTNDGFTLYYLPDKEIFQLSQFLLEISLILVDVILIFILARIFARKALQPIKDIHSKYQQGKEKQDYTDIFSEIDNMLNDAISQYTTITVQAEQLQQQLKQQLLRQLLNKTYSSDIQMHLNRLNLSFPGSFYYVISIAFHEKSNVEELLQKTQKELECFTPPEEPSVVYVVHDLKSKQLWIICNLSDAASKDEVTESILEIVESYTDHITVGTGKLYNHPDKISASWLESLDNLSNAECNHQTNLIYHSDSLEFLSEALSIGSKENALKWLDEYNRKHEQMTQSLLMLQYFIAEFIGELNKLSKMNHIVLSNQNISLLFSARDTASFHNAAKELIIEYCSKYQQNILDIKDEQVRQIRQYIDTHFMEYDISIELVAENLGIATAIVRDALQKSTGMMYKDYLTKLRMEYAKKLLQEGTLSVAEISQAVGYSSVSYFIRLFKNTTGTTPAKYLKSFKQL